MASGVGGAGGPNKFPYGDHDDDIQSNSSGQSGQVGGHGITSASFEERRKKLEKKLRPGTPSSRGSSEKGKSKGKVRQALQDVWSRVKSMCSRNHDKMQISNPTLPQHVKVGVRTPGVSELMLKLQGKGQGEHGLMEEGAHGPDSKGDVASASGGEDVAVSTAEGPERSSRAEGASGFRGVFSSGTGGFAKIKGRLAGIFKPGHSGGSDKLTGSSGTVFDIGNVTGIGDDEPRGPVTGMTREELLEAERNLSDLIDKASSGPRKAQLRKWRGSLERDRNRIASSGGVGGAEQPFDPMGCSNEELQRAVAEGLACEEALKELDKVLEDAEKDMDSSEVSGPASSGSRRSVHTEEGSGIEETRSDAVGQQQKIHWLRRLLLFLLRVVRSFLRSAKQKLINARRAAMEWIRRACPCRHGVYQVNLDEDEVRRQRTAEWVTRHFGSGRGGVVLTEETVNHLSGDASLEGEEWKVETYFRDFQRLIEETEKKAIAPTSKAVNVLRIFTNNISDWLPSVGFSK